jgi:hypothetical protein
MAALLEDIVVPSFDPRRGQATPHLVGTLSRVSLFSLLALLEWESITGVITLKTAGKEGTIYLRNGSPIDAEEVGSALTARDALRCLLLWSEGEFELRVGEVTRVDCFGVG